jgi:hypothetical protein
VIDLTVERLEQTYRRLPSDDGLQRYDYRAPVFDFESRRVYDEAGLLLDYPGIASRAYWGERAPITVHVRGLRLHPEAGPSISTGKASRSPRSKSAS